ncbi:MAG TPA: energy transducer TonB [Candidatus Tumulicola sp.]|jgi:TonB family protein
MNATQCSRAEILAGAIALGEASEAQRDAYRRHVAACAGCIAALGGEREIERTMAIVAVARDGESWEPDVLTTLRAGRRTHVRAWRFGAAAIAAAAALALGGYALLTSGARNAPATLPSTVAYRAPAAPAGLTQPKAAAHAQARVAARPRLVVVHNTVTLRRPAAAEAPAQTPARTVAAVRPQPAAGRVHAASRPAVLVAALTPSERDRRSIAALRTVETAPPADPHAESIQLVPSSSVIRDVFPLGGENAIVPRPPAIAYSENASGTTAFEVSVDERGTPVKCTITKASGYLVLDEAVCRAAMHARYSPRTINGRAVASSYSDAFTFRLGDDQ